ncbi:MAG: hypothetical protein AB1578_02820 [Thermodesulfobacteriota bacterium]
MRTFRPLGALLAACLLVGASGAPPAPAGGLDGRLAQLVASGELDPSRADLYRLYAVVAAERLPPAFRAAPPDDRAPRVGGARGEGTAWMHRCGTPVLRGVKHRLAALSPADRAEAEALLAPPARAAPRAVVSSDTGKTGETVLPNFVVTRNFTVEWGPALTNEDGSLPLRDLDANGIPDVVERWAELFEASFEAVAEVLKPGDPASVYAGTPLATRLVPVYLGNSSEAETIENISSGTYAFTQDSAPVPYVVVNNDLRFVPPNDEGATTAARIRGAMKITAAHEFFHVIHFVYEPAAWIPSADDWWLETSATWMEDEVFPDVNDHYQYFGINGWPSTVEEGLAVNFSDSRYVVRAYGGVIFAKYLSEHVGGSAMMGEVWDLIRSDPPPGRRILDALEAYAISTGFRGLGELFLGFAGANAVMDYEEGPHYGSVPRTSGIDGLRFFGLGYLGARYRFEDAVSGEIVLTYATPTESGWGIAAVFQDPATGAYVYRTALAADGEVTLPLDVPSGVRLHVAAARVTAAAVPAEPPPASSGGGGGGGCFLQALRGGLWGVP